MSDIRDDDLILFHYRDGLPSERLRAIEQALAASPALDARYQALRRLLAEADRDVPPRPDAQFEARLWQRLQTRMETQRLDGPGAPDAPIVATAPPMRAAARRSARPRRRLRPWSVGLASAAGLASLAMLAVTLYFPAARNDAPMQPPSVQHVAAQAAMADRVLADRVATHLRSTEGLLLSVINNDSATLMPADDALVRSLVDDNRLYAAAAAQRGDKALTGFLQTLDPVLIELANQLRTGDIQQDQGLRDLVHGSDMLFQVRAVEARLQSRGNIRVKTRGAMT
ncbi:hypothetical protein [Montanilutibacter psychrotolerans]|uniref:Anti-sigma factor n=1 Tax=Montanilutibacter psychrotolerans TaxID=1327343 RepID=A0A3M8SZP6_9GAMM|nr:hypothetical protein [Lysobacter psychrotolerans]RNF86243.1 hypothetical protein EER27_02130 [Lysobacter psychrotolerans]